MDKLRGQDPLHESLLFRRQRGRDVLFRLGEQARLVVELVGKRALVILSRKAPLARGGVYDHELWTHAVKGDFGRLLSRPRTVVANPL